MKKALIISVLFFLFFCGYSQNDSLLPQKHLVEFSGVILNADSLTPVSFAHIFNKNRNSGDVADYYGYFTIIGKTYDTIVFSSVGYKKAEYIIPDSLITGTYSLIQVMVNDTIHLSGAVVHPWSNYEQFKRAFLQLEIPEDDYDRAKKNLARAELKEKFEKMPMTASMNYKNYINQQVYDMSYTGMQPQSLTSMVNNPLLNPFAWAKFFEAWKNGDFKRKDN